MDSKRKMVAKYVEQPSQNFDEITMCSEIGS
jgi:hypothetical protein